MLVSSKTGAFRIAGTVFFTLVFTLLSLAVTSSLVAQDDASKKDEAPAAAASPGKASPGDLIQPKTEDIPTPVNDAKAIEVIDRYIKAVGGLENLKSIQDKVLKFDTTKHGQAQETVAKLSLFLKRGWKVREEWDLSAFKIKDRPLRFVQVYNGTDGWVQMFGTVSNLEGRTLSIFVWDKPLDDFFCHWKDDGYTVTYVNEGVVNDEPVEIVQTTDFVGRNRVRYSFSKKTGLLLKKEWREQGQKGFGRKEDFYSGYKKIPFSDDSQKWIMVALKHKILLDGKPDTDRNYFEVAFNTGLKDSIFERPPGIAFNKMSEQLEKSGGRSIFDLQGGGGPASIGPAPGGKNSDGAATPTAPAKSE